jgi:predicted AlkP superfamily pyrophosphatase or phosphodiesterase
MLITLDGWHVKLTDRMPVWQEMTAAGSWTLKAQVPRGATTVISHAALYTGADPRVNGVVRELENTGPDTHVHGVKFRWTPFKKVADDGTVTYTMKDTIFTAVKAAGYKATAVVQKGKLVGELSPDGDETGIHVYGDSGLIKAACAAVRDDDTRLVILHIGSPDGAGHNHGWLSDEQYKVAEQVSGQLQTIRQCLADAEAAGGVPTTLIVTSDHGGTPNTVVDGKIKKHGHGANNPDNLTVPWIIVGPGIKQGYEIQASVRLVDTAPTILRILGIPASSIPTLSGVSVDEVFRP